MNGYIQIDLGGELRSLKFNMYAVELIANRQIDSEAANLATFIYAGLCGNTFAKSGGVNPIFEKSFDEVMEWADDLLIDGKHDVIKNIMTAYYQSKPIQKVLQQEAEETAKKKTKKK